MMDAGRHPNIKLFTHSELIRVTGREGDFLVTIRKYPRYVDEALCTACGQCSEKCPVVVPNEYDVGLAERKAIYSPFPQAVPSAYIIDKTHCLNDDFIVCENCRKACDPKAVDYDQTEEDIEIPVSAILLSTGTGISDPSRIGSYSYGLFPDVLTGLEFERMLSASGPTQGHVIRPSDREVPKKIAFIQCVGVRGELDNHYCSRFCCMNSIKSAMLARDHEPGIEEILIYFIDIRAFGKGYEDFYRRVKEHDWIRFVQGKPSKILEDKETGQLILFTEDLEKKSPERTNVDLVVLASPGVPDRKETEALAKILGVETDTYGFFKTRDGVDGVLESTREGIFLCGCSAGPEDIPDSVSQASGAAVRAAKYMADERLPVIKEEIPQINTDGPPRIGVFLCHCGINIAGILNIPGLEEYAMNLPNVVHVQNDLFLCSDVSQKKIQEMIVEKGINRVVAAACTPRTHEPIFRDTIEKIGLNPYLFEMVNVRDQCSWVHSNIPDSAQQRALDQLEMAVARAALLEPLESKEIPMNNGVLVVGGGIAGIQSALDLEAQGFPVYLVEKDKRLGGRLNALNTLYPHGDDAKKLLRKKLQQLERSNVQVMAGTEVTGVKGFVGNFEIETTGDRFKVGAVILAPGAGLYNPNGEFGYGKMPNVITNMELEGLLAGEKEKLKKDHIKSVCFIQCVGSRDPEKNPGCSRYCCTSALKQAIQLKEAGINVSIMYRDMRTVSHGAEELYRKARSMGIVFVRFADEVKPVVEGKDRATTLRVLSKQLGEDVEVKVDMVVLSVALAPLQKEYARFREMFKIPVSADGFFMERHPKLGPVETHTNGIFLCGSAQGPKEVRDSIMQASAAAGKASTLVSLDYISLEPTTCYVEEGFCRACGRCVEICDFNAPELVENEQGFKTARINEALCKGCGTCAACCPTGAIVARHYRDEQIGAILRSLFGKRIA